MSENPDTYLYGESKRSLILIFNPAANCSIVSILGLMSPILISAIVDLGIPVIMETWRSVSLCLYIISSSKIFIYSFYPKNLLYFMEIYGNQRQLKIVLEVIIYMEYIFENEIALEIYYLITKELKIKLTPKGFKKRVYLSEKFLMTCLSEIYAIKEKKFSCFLGSSAYPS